MPGVGLDDAGQRLRAAGHVVRRQHDHGVARMAVPGAVDHAVGLIAGQRDRTRGLAQRHRGHGVAAHKQHERDEQQKDRVRDQYCSSAHRGPFHGRIAARLQDDAKPAEYILNGRDSLTPDRAAPRPRRPRRVGGCRTAGRGLRRSERQDHEAGLLPGAPARRSRQGRHRGVGYLHGQSRRHRGAVAGPRMGGHRRGAGPAGATRECFRRSRLDRAGWRSASPVCPRCTCRTPQSASAMSSSSRDRATRVAGLRRTRSGAPHVHRLHVRQRPALEDHARSHRQRLRAA